MASSALNSKNEIFMRAFDEFYAILSKQWIERDIEHVCEFFYASRLSQFACEIHFLSIEIPLASQSIAINIKIDSNRCERNMDFMVSFIYSAERKWQMPYIDYFHQL